MKLLLDSHALLWFCDGNASLSEPARAAIEDARNEKHVSHATAWEVAIKARLGKLKLAVPFEELFPGRRIFCRGASKPGHKTALLQTDFLANVSSMSTVELAVRKVKKLSARQAKELLGWLTARQPNGTKQPPRPSRRKASARRAMQKLKAWQDSVRGTTDWQPPRMPDDLVKPVRL